MRSQMRHNNHPTNNASEIVTKGKQGRAALVNQREAQKYDQNKHNLSH